MNPMTTFNNAQLFNCCTDERAPNWSDFTWLEIGGCVTFVADDGTTVTEGGIDDDKAEFWTVYGRCNWGGCEAITDCKTRPRAEAVALELARLSGLEIR
jgi:hypothetical protein